MKKRIVALTAGAVLCMGFSGPYEDLVEDRTQPVGRVCLEGQSCGRGGSAQTDSPTAVANTGARSGNEVYQAGCAVCHDAGIGGAHRLQDNAAWATLAAKGRDLLIRNAVNGIGAMPARGVCINCSDDEIATAVDYMLSSAEL